MRQTVTIGNSLLEFSNEAISGWTEVFKGFYTSSHRLPEYIIGLCDLSFDAY